MDDFLAFSRTGYQDSGTWAFVLLQNPPSLPQVTVTASLLHSLHKCSASLREHGQQKASHEVTSALTNEYDQNHVKLSDPLAELGARSLITKSLHSFPNRAALFGTFIEHLVHLFRDEGKTLYASRRVSANHYSCRWHFFLLYDYIQKPGSSEHDMLPIGIGEENGSKTIWSCLKNI